jgi:hypothetical protein
MSWPAFLYAGYTADQNNLEEGLFKSTLLVHSPFHSCFNHHSSFKIVTIPLRDDGYERLAKCGESCRPLAMFRVDNEFLLCYDGQSVLF